MPTQREAWKTYKNVFDESTIQNLEKMRSQHHFDDLKSPISVGKEANIFSASKGDDQIIVKIYRVENCNFNQMYRYIEPDPRYHGLKKRRRLVIFAWVQREYRNLLKAREVIRVPMPIAVKDSVLLMEFIGHKDAAPKLKDSNPQDPEKLFKKIITGIRALWKAGLVHADLSEFNILTFEEEPIFIDFSQSTTTEHPQALEYLKRDVHNICKAFRKFGLKKDDEEEYKKILG